MKDLADCTVAELIELFRSADADPIEAVQACLRRIEERDDVLNATLETMSGPATARAEAAAQRWREGRARPLEGVPFGIKDVIAAEGVRTTGGSGIYQDLVPHQDADVIRALIDAGAVPVAKLQTFAFALGSPSNPDFGVTRNPRDTSRIAGGSSSGAASAVASGMLPLAIGTDTGGSVRLPAAYCGVCGLRPSPGRISSAGSMLVSWSLDTVGPIARTCRDLELTLAVLSPSSPGRKDGALYGKPRKPADLTGLRIGLPDSWFFDRCEPAVTAALDNAVRELEDLGANLAEVNLPHVHLAEAIGRTIVTAEVGYLHRGMDPLLDRYDSSLRARVIAAQTLPAIDYLHALELRQLVSTDFAEAFTCVDVIVTPASVGVAPQVDDLVFQLPSGPEPWTALVTRTSYPASIAGIPALSVPAAMPVGEMPVGMQILAPGGSDELCLAVGCAYEAAAQPNAQFGLRSPQVHTEDGIGVAAE
jgi:aspartyl-tRNA(Asn)/glutamyl-tRNA(Gln) amidotransferase subunit A